MKISPVTPQIVRVTNAHFWMRWQKSAHLAEYLNNYLTDLREIFNVGRHVYGHYKNDISFVVIQGKLLG